MVGPMDDVKDAMERAIVELKCTCKERTSWGECEGFCTKAQLENALAKLGKEYPDEVSNPISPNHRQWNALQKMEKVIPESNFPVGQLKSGEILFKTASGNFFLIRRDGEVQSPEAFYRSK